MTGRWADYSIFQNEAEFQIQRSFYIKTIWHVVVNDYCVE